MLRYSRNMVFKSFRISATSIWKNNNLDNKIIDILIQNFYRTISRNNNKSYTVKPV